MENEYQNLLKIYNENSSYDFINQCRRLREIIRNKYSDEIINSDINPLYPNIEDPDFNSILFKKSEFNIYKDYKYNKDLGFSLNKTQRFIKAFMSRNTPYNGILLFHSVGQGKTCTSITIAENMLKYYEKPVLVISSIILAENYKKQIFDIKKYNILTNKADLCTGTKYPDMIFNKDKLTEEQLNNNINLLINSRYEFIGYDRLSNKINSIIDGFLGNKKYEEMSPHEQILFDTKVNEAIDIEYSNRIIIIDEAHSFRDSTSTKISTGSFKKLLTNTKNVKLILMSATPMYDNASEIITLLNFLLLNDNRKEIDSKEVFENEDKVLTKNGANILKKYLRGYVSFVDFIDEKYFPNKLDPNKNITTYIDKYPLVVTKSSQYQKEQIEKIKDLKDRNPDLQSLFQAYNIVYPSENIFGLEGFNDCFYKDKNGVKYDNSENQFLRYDSIKKYSPKIKTILDNVINSEGIVFIFTRFYYGGVFPLMLALEHIGFSRYAEPNYGNNLIVDNKFGNKKMSYIVIGGKEVTNGKNDYINVLTNPENKNGDIIKVVIGTQVASEGLDLKNIRQIHMLDPWYNLNRMEQIIGRGIRYNSHVNLEPSKRNVTVFLHAIEEHDVDIYKTAIGKQKVIDDVIDILKHNSIDCYMHGNCSLNENIDTSIDNYDNIFFNERDLYIKYIDFIFNERYLTFPEIKNKIKNYFPNMNNNILIDTIQYILDNNIIIKGKYTLIYRSDLYILKDINMNSDKLTIDEIINNDKKYRKYIDLNKLDLKKDDNNYDMENIIEHIEILKLNIEDILDKFNIDKNIFEYEIIQFVIDSLDDNKLLSFVTYSHMNNYLKEMFDKGLANSEVVIEDYYYHHFTDTFYILKEKKYVLCDDFDLGRLYSKKEYKNLTLLIDRGLENNKTAYISKEGLFKVRLTPTGKGQTCDKISGKKEFLLKKLESINNIVFKKYITVVEICILYQLFLRKYHSEQFQRPFFIPKK